MALQSKINMAPFIRNWDHSTRQPVGDPGSLGEKGLACVSTVYGYGLDR